MLCDFHGCCQTIGNMSHGELVTLPRTGTLKKPFFPGSLKKAVHDDPYLTLGTACNWPDLLIGRVDL